MGNGHSKGETSAETGILSPLCKFMSERYPGSLNQIQKWVELGFPPNGSLSENQLKQLKVQLRRMEISCAAQHATLSKRKQEKVELLKADWGAFRMWRDESERREKQRLKAFNSLKSEKSTKISHPKTLYPCLSEVLRKSVDPDLDSAPPPLLPHPTSPSNHLSQVHQLCQHTPLLLRCKKTCQIHPLALTSRPFHLL